MIDRVTFVLLYSLNDQLREQVLCYQRFFFFTNKTRLLITEFAAGHKSMRDKHNLKPDVRSHVDFSY